MIDTILFDLDGTLLQFRQDEFIKVYFTGLSKKFAGLGIAPDNAVKAVWAGTKAMVQNDGTELNTKRFWDAFAASMNICDEFIKKIEAICDDFYLNEFNQVKSILKYSDIPKNIVKNMYDKGYTLALATNPLFPECGVISRLKWGDIEPSYFTLITHYGNSSYCKPNLGYYREILEKLNKKPEQCLMVGNNPVEDMVVRELGMQVFLLTDFIEGDSDIDVSDFRRGSIIDMEQYLHSLPNLS